MMDIFKTHYKKIFVGALNLVTIYIGYKTKSNEAFTVLTNNMSYVLVLQLIKALPLSKIFRHYNLPTSIICSIKILLNIAAYKTCNLISNDINNKIVDNLWSFMSFYYVMVSAINFILLFMIIFSENATDTYQSLINEIIILKNGINALLNHYNNGNVHKLTVMYKDFTIYTIPKYEITEEKLEEIAPLKCKGTMQIKNTSGLNGDSDAETEAEVIEKNTDDVIDCDLSQCSICLREIPTDQLHRVLPCDHKFHPHCIDNWLMYKSLTCPMCREDVVELHKRNQEAQQLAQLLSKFKNSSEQDEQVQE
jgi:Ring finger domain